MAASQGRPRSGSAGSRPTAMSREVQRLEITFKEPMATFKAGDMLSGNVMMDLVQELKIKGVQMLVHGLARAQWDEQRAYTKGSAGKLSHRNAEVYIDEMVVITSRADTLTPGHYNWPFNVRLPLYLPASFDDQHWGRVQYMAKVIVERPWKAAIEVTRPFTVLGMLDLNTEPEAKKPAENHCETMLGAGCCKSGPVSCHVMLPRRGFAVGQSIPFTAQIENNSRKTLGVRVVLSQNATFRADKQVRRSSTVLKVVSRQSEVRPGETVSWIDEVKDIPPVAPSRLGGGCKMIELKYFMTVIAVPSGPGKDMEVPVEIIIGTVPLRKVPEATGARLSVESAMGQKRSRSQQSVNATG